MRLRRRTWVLIAAGVLAGAAAATLIRLHQPLRSLTGSVSRILCSGIFVSGLSPAQVYEQALRPLAGIRDNEHALRYEVDRERREVRATFAGAYERRSVYMDGRGCTLDPGDGLPALRPLASPRAETSALLPEIAADAIVAPASDDLRLALERAFAEPGPPNLTQTAAVVVVHDGRVIAERYAPGYGVDTRILGWSAGKSVTSALIGILVRDGRLSVHGPAPVPRWRDPADPRYAISIDMLLRMTSGLDLPETNRDYDAVARMQMNEPDMGAFAESAGLSYPPGKVWKYSSGNTMILSRILRDAIGGGPEEVLAFAQRELFGPLGMRRVTLEFDAVGTPLGMGYLYLSARDWARFGMLYLEDGVVGGRRILPEGWVRYSATQTLATPYAAGFWRESSARRARWQFPEDAFLAAGVRGQRIMIVPSERLVVARFGNAHGPTYGFEGFAQLVLDVRRALARPG